VGFFAEAKFRDFIPNWWIFFLAVLNFHDRVPNKEWSFQDGGLYIIKKVGVKILTIIVLYRLS
jgi:hypothetical protein